MLTAEQESTIKPKTNAQPVAEKTPATVEPFDIEGIKKKIPKAFQGYIEPIAQWIQRQEEFNKSVEERLQIIGNVTPDSIAEALQKRAIEVQKERAMQPQIQPQYSSPPQGAPQQGGFDLGPFMPLISQAIGSGGGSYDEEMQNLTKEIMRANLDRIKQDGSFTDAIKSAIVSKIAGKAASDIVGNI